MSSAPAIPLRVECYAGYRAEERPEAFWLCDRRVAVRAILDRWYGEGTPTSSWSARTACDTSCGALSIATDGS
jgi:hypothetical protein